ncbi:hypothetical protein ACIA58_11740 [Kribbella sp. NPDC051586]|uniref:hypothetical protein n=1 Tax=Kribbella sp. NPDC051586 TaxID=3364118 RepID=UPI0037A4A5BD
MSNSALAVLPSSQPDTWFSARLRRRLYAYRAALSEEWSESTIHPDFVQGPGLPASTGQCGVSSAWLLHELPLLLRARSRYCVGDILVGNQTLQFHCWIEIGHPACPDRWVIDLTCDQYELLADRAFVCDRHSTLAALAIEYKALVHLSARELKHDPVWCRTQVLATGMSRWFSQAS